MIKKICLNSLLLLVGYLCISCGAPANQNVSNTPKNDNAASSSGKSFKLAHVELAGPDTTAAAVTGAMIGGGADGIHKIISVFTNFLDTTSANLEARRPADSSRV